ncbi:sel1 repeat family protein [Stappia sp. F7233]|uniref:Sel1 repeat family protein n=1 Tax=Stappia albiluteola TaxID=2758565 RepID=A0A839ADF0_9HYPH|nr:tetratricopeptide repeat protein [Stappia albiluteola]MBA5776669.1 sel1 repeat family protein [Stappia albiluteola]
MRILRSGFVLAGSLVLLLTAPSLALDGQKVTEGGVISPSDMSPGEALRVGTKFYYAGEKARAVDSLRFAADNGHPLAAWKLGRMYAAGDGVEEDDIKAFEYFRQIATQYGDDSPTSPRAPFVANAFVALGGYYLTGIQDSAIEPNTAKAKEIFTYAASYFGDADAQYQLGRLYLEDKTQNTRMAARWLKLAAGKGHVEAQGRLGELLFTSDAFGDSKARGLMWLTIARERARPDREGWIVETQERCFGLADEATRRRAERLARSWLDKNPITIAGSN